MECLAALGDLNELKAEREMLQAAFEKHLKSFKSQSFDGRIQEACSRVAAVRQHVGIPRGRIPAACTKKPSALTPFERLVLEQLAAGLRARISKLSELLEVDTPAALAAANSAERAQAMSERQQRRVTKELCAAEAELRNVVDFVNVAKEAVAHEAMKRDTLVAIWREKVALLDNFMVYTEECFAMLLHN